MGMIALLAIAAVLFVLLRPYFFRYDTAIGLTGTMGSGKTFTGVNPIGLTELRKSRASVRWYNLFHPRHKKPKPLMYTSIPVYIGFGEWSQQLRLEHILLQEKMVEGSVTIYDEVDFFANQFEFKNPNLRRIGDYGGAFDEFVRLYRHYVNGKLIVTAQSSDNIVLNIRRRLNNIYNLYDFRTYGLFGVKLFYTVKVRNISISEDIKTIQSGQYEDDFDLRYGFLPLKRHYATRCFKHRYDTLDDPKNISWRGYYTNRNINLPDSVQESKTNKE